MSTRPPLRYQVSITRRGPIEAAVESAPRAVITGGPPPEFGGDPTCWSPEQLLVAAAGLCFWSTLEWFARRRGVPLAGLECSAEGDVARSAEGFAFSGIRLEVAGRTSAGQEGALRELMEVAKKSCLVARSLACPVELSAKVTADAGVGEPSLAAG